MTRRMDNLFEENVCRIGKTENKEK